MPYKYQSKLDEVSASLTRVTCPCHEAISRECLAYRIARLPANDPINFLPRPLEGAPPPRNIDIPINATVKQIVKTENKKCDWWGISLHENPDASRAVYNQYPGAFPYATHIAELHITPQDGTCTPTDRNAHFNLHEFSSATLGANVLKAISL